MLYALPRTPAAPSQFVVRDAPGMDGEFLDDLREFISRRLDRIDPYRESAEYGREQERASRLYDEIEAMLPADGRAKLFEYSDTLSAAHYLETAILVEHAFLDGMRMVQKAVMSYEF